MDHALRDLVDRRSRIVYTRMGRVIARVRVFPDGRRVRLSAYTYDTDADARWAERELGRE